ncbi:PIR protein CIR protein [Plasmodium vinckei vinckei]|uniref:PIR protein CIR protein n=1 Tax=Plasmodium vinckei vinckei TaxID=54757 RepID=A0A449BMP3_PLAVN|nr:PIR protein CIR protein [Plasmodium vinckei vinckei]VEV54726.1 PIR protein CIR protein [Plasmodium vinckei vinckei]
MDINACGTFRELDALFIKYMGNEDEFNNEYGSYNEYCPVKNGLRKCENDYEKLTAISGYAYKEFLQNDNIDLESENDLSADFLVMGLCDILYKLSKDPNISLKDSFEKYLGKPIGSFNYWNILRNKKYFIGSNIGIMNGFYLLFKEMCETINTYEKPGVQQYQYVNSATQCYIMYEKLYNVVSRCGPYLRLLDHFKTIYNGFIDAAIKDNNYDESLRSKLIKLSSIDTTKLGYEFNSKGCQKLHNKLAQTTPKIITLATKMLKDDGKRMNDEGSQSAEDNDDEDDDNLDLDEEEDGFELDEEDDDFELDDDLQNPLQETPSVPAPGAQQPTQSALEPAKPVSTPSGTSSSIPGNGSDTTGSKDKIVDGTQSQENTKGSEQTDTSGGTENKANLKNDPSTHLLTSDTNQGNSNDGLVGGTGDTNKGALNTDDGQDDKGGQVGGSNGDQVNQRSLGSSGDGSGSDPVEKGSQSMSGDPVDTGQSFFRITLKGIDKLNTGFKFFEKHKKKIVEAKETINNLYNTSMSNIKTAYDNSRKILNSIIDNISNQPEKVNMPSTLDGNRLGSGGTGAGPPTPNNLPTPQKDSPQIFVIWMEKRIEEKKKHEKGYKFNWRKKTGPNNYNFIES